MGLGPLPRPPCRRGGYMACTERYLGPTSRLRCRLSAPRPSGPPRARTRSHACKHTHTLELPFVGVAQGGFLPVIASERQRAWHTIQWEAALGPIRNSFHPPPPSAEAAGTGILLRQVLAAVSSEPGWGRQYVWPPQTKIFSFCSCYLIVVVAGGPPLSQFRHTKPCPFQTFFFFPFPLSLLAH